LAEMEEVRGYTLGETTRDFYDEEGQREDMATIKGWIIEDALTALGFSDDITLGALMGKYITVEVIGLDGRVDFTDEYTFEFVQDPDVIAANEVIALINELPGVDELTLDDKDKVEAARNAYEALPERQKALVNNIDILVNAETRISEIEAKESVIIMINELPTVEELTLEDKADVVAARSAYEELTEDQKESIEQDILQKLESAEAQITDLEQTALTELNGLISTASDRTRPDYTVSISEWNTYWNGFFAAKDEAGQVCSGLEGKDKLTLEESTDLVAALQGLKRAMEILDGIEDFDASFGDRVSPIGCEKTINDQSRTSNRGNRLRAYYDEENSDFYWLLSGKLQKQNFYTGTSGTGLKTGLMRVMVSEPLIRAESGDYTIEIYKSNGTRKTEKELESDGMNLAIDWVGGFVNAITKKYSFLAGKSFDFKLIGQTSDGTEFQRSYTFHFIDAGIQEFNPDVDYCVVNGEVQPCDGEDIQEIIVQEDLGVVYLTTESVDFDITVDLGTDVTDAIAALNATISVVGAEGEEGVATIEWTIADYDGTIAGDYTAIGTVILPEGWVGIPDCITATVTVLEEQIDETYTVTVLAENGTVTGTGSYEVGDLVTLEAIAEEGYVFVNWTDGEDVVSTENPYTFIMPAEIVELTADFEREAKKEEDGELDTTFIDAAIEAAIAAKEGIAVSEDGKDVLVGTYWVTQDDMDALDAAIAVAEVVQGDCGNPAGC
jgi:hypothetical protein